MKLSEYGILEDKDILINGDEVRISTPYSNLTQLADVDLDYRRMVWNKVSSYWIGKKFDEYKRGLRGCVEGRRKLSV